MMLKSVSNLSFLLGAEKYIKTISEICWHHNCGFVKKNNSRSQHFKNIAIEIRFMAKRLCLHLFLL